MKFSLLVPNVEISGGNRGNFELANALIELGHEVQIFYPMMPGRDGLSYWHIRKTGVQVVKGLRNALGQPAWFEHLGPVIGLPYFSRATLASRLPEADYLIFSWWAHAELVMDLAPALGEPVHLIRSMEYWGGPETQVTAAYQAPVLKVVTSESLRQQIESRFGAVAGIVQDGVSLKLFKPNNELPADGITVGMMYRRQPLKRMKDGIAALLEVQRQHPDVKILLFGERLTSEDRKALRDLQNWRHILFPTGERLRDIYQSLDVFLFPSGPEEAFGLPPLEAMACGCAVVSTRVGALEEYSSHQTSSLLCDVGDVETLAAMLSRLVEDASLRASLAEAASQRVTDYGWDVSARRLMALLSPES